MILHESTTSAIYVSQKPDLKLSVRIIATTTTTTTTTIIVRGEFQTQLPIGWLKKYKIEDITLLYGRATYITALLLHIVSIHI
jgi:hypothetical protein